MQAEGDGEVGEVETAHELGSLHLEKGVARPGDEPLFDAARAHVAELRHIAEFPHEGEIGDDVPRAPAARKEDIFHKNSIFRPPIFIAARCKPAPFEGGGCHGIAVTSGGCPRSSHNTPSVTS